MLLLHADLKMPQIHITEFNEFRKKESPSSDMRSSSLVEFYSKSTGHNHPFTTLWQIALTLMPTSDVYFQRNMTHPDNFQSHRK